MENIDKDKLNDNIESVWGNADFGQMTKIDVVKFGLLKCASGYYQGYTSTCILEELGMITKEYKLTPKGKAWLWEFFRNGSNF